jgi:hypothetical protein
VNTARTVTITNLAFLLVHHITGGNRLRLKQPVINEMEAANMLAFWWNPYLAGALQGKVVGIEFNSLATCANPSGPFFPEFCPCNCRSSVTVKGMVATPYRQCSRRFRFGSKGFGALAFHDI